jgi:hypothetical protein
MAIVRSREALVGTRTQLVNHVRGAVKSFGARLPKCLARSFHKRASEHIPEALWPALGPILEQIGSLTKRIHDYDRKLETISKETYPETELLRQVEGVGTLTALTFVLTVDLDRISHPHHRVANPGSHFGGEEAHVLQRLLVGDARRPGPEAEVVVGCLFVEPSEAIGHLSRVADEVPLPQQVFGSGRLRLRLAPVGAPLRVAAPLVGDAGSHLAASPL